MGVPPWLWKPPIVLLEHMGKYSLIFFGSADKEYPLLGLLLYDLIEPKT